jgi:hypothetical protein
VDEDQEPDLDENMNAKNTDENANNNNNDHVEANMGTPTGDDVNATGDDVNGEIDPQIASKTYAPGAHVTTATYMQPWRASQ